MALDRERQPGRAAVQPKEATKLPGAPHDARTIIARLKRPASDPRSYQGYATFDGASGRIPRYYVYLDQFDHWQAEPQLPAPQPAADRDPSGLHAQLRAAETTNTELLAANADLRTRLAHAEGAAETLRSDLARVEAAHARDQEIIRVLAATNAMMADAAETIQDSADSYRQAGEKALAGAGKYLKVTQLQRDALAQYITPDDLSGLTP